MKLFDEVTISILNSIAKWLSKKPHPHASIAEQIAASVVDAWIGVEYTDHDFFNLSLYKPLDARFLRMVARYAWL